MDVLSSRVLVRPVDPDRSRLFYGETLGLAIFREYGTGAAGGVVYFTGGGFLELSGRSEPGPRPAVALWLQVRDAEEVHVRLVEAGAQVDEPPLRKPWGLIEMWARDPDGIQLAIVEVPGDHPLRRRT